MSDKWHRLLTFIILMFLVPIMLYMTIDMLKIVGRGHLDFGNRNAHADITLDSTVWFCPSDKSAFPEHSDAWEALNLGYCVSLDQRGFILETIESSKIEEQPKGVLP